VAEQCQKIDFSNNLVVPAPSQEPRISASLRDLGRCDAGPDHCTPREPHLATSYTEKFWVSADELKLYARVYPGPEPLARAVLCLHGLTRNSRDFEDLAPHLQQHYRVIVPDVRGRGLSARDPNPQNYQPAIYLQDILALLDAVDAQRVAIIGTSMGGLLAMMMAAGSRDRVSGVVLNDMGAGSRSEWA